MSRVVRVAVPDLAPGEQELDGEAARYLLRVHRLRSGDSFVAFDPARALEADATLLTGKRCRVGELREALRGFDITLLQGLGKGDKLEQVVRDATALGAGRIVAVETARSVARIARGVSRRARLLKIATESARQCGRADVPSIDGPLALADALEGLSPGALRLVLDPRSSRPLGKVAWNGDVPVVLLVGPEGGLADDEIDQARRAGFGTASLGPFVLRTETAAVAAVSALVARGTWR